MTLNLLLNQLETNLFRFTQTYAAVQIFAAKRHENFITKITEIYNISIT